MPIDDPTFSPTSSPAGPQNQIFWYQSPGARRGCPCLFLDRDGVVVVEVDYLHRVGDVRIETGVGDLIAQARRAGLAVGIVSNQSGIGRGLFDWTAFTAVQAEIIRQLDQGTDPFDFIAACGTHPEAAYAALRVTEHNWRKPAPGMIRMAAEALDLDLPASIMVGDHVTDLEAGLSGGVGTLVHLMTGHGAKHRPAAQRLQASVGGRRLLLLNDLNAASDALGLRGKAQPSPI